MATITKKKRYNMALMKCAECRKDMSDTLEACPHCGFKVVQTIETVQVTESDTKCSSCGKSYYRGASKCPYCKAINTNQVNPYSNSSSNASDVGVITLFFKLINGIVRFIVSIIKKYPKQLAICVVIIAVVFGLYTGSMKIYSITPNKYAAEELDNNLNQFITNVELSLKNGNLGDASSKAKSGIDEDNASEYNYFKINGINEENNLMYFGGNYNKKKQELKLLLDQIVLASIALDDLKDYDPSKITDIRVQKAFALAVEIAKEKKLHGNTTSSSNASSSSTSSSSGEINAGVRFSNTQIMITNNDSRTWVNTRIKINDDYKLNLGTIPAGKVTTINMSECATSSGERFNPYVTKFQNIYIGTDNGYFYSSNK